MVSKNISLLKWYNFFYDFRPYEAIAVLYYVSVTGSFALGLMVFAIASIAAAIFEVPTGVMSDRIGRKKTVIYGSVSSVVAISLYAFGGSFLWLALGAIFNGLTRALLSGNNDALLYDTLRQQKKTHEFAEKLGKVKSMFEIGLAVSALLASALAFVSLQAVMVVSIVPQVVCALISLRFIEPGVHDAKIPENIYSHLRQAVNAFVVNAKLRKLSAAYVLDYAIEETYFQFKPAFIATLWPTWALGLSRALDNLLGFLGFHFAGRIVAWLGELKTLFAHQTLGRINMLVGAGLPSPISPVLLSINAFFYGIGETASGSLLQKEFTDRQRATMGSLNSFAGNILYAVAMVGTGIVADRIGPAKTILLLGIMAISVVLIYGEMYINRRK
jgi:MFS family permease